MNNRIIIRFAFCDILNNQGLGNLELDYSGYHKKTSSNNCPALGLGPLRGGGILPYKGLMGMCGQPGYVLRDFCLKRAIEFIIFCLNRGIDLSIFVLNRINILNRISKIGILS